MAITADNTVAFETKLLDHEGMKCDLPVAASTVIYKNSLVGLNATGYLVSYVPWEQALTPTGTPFIGIALEHVASQTSDGDKRCKVLVDGFFEYTLTGAAQADVGKPVYASDNSTLAIARANNELVGRMVDYPAANKALVELASPTERAGIAGGIMYKVREVDFANVVNDEMYFVHEVENHNGMYLNTAFGIITEEFVCTSAAGVATFVHTLGTDTTLGCTLTGVNAGPVNDLIQGAGGLAADGASTANMIPIPADVAVIAKITTVNAGGDIAGKANICASFILI